MSNENEENKYEDFPKYNELKDFKTEVERYKPKDLIDFCEKYFQAQINHKPLVYDDLSGLEKFVLTPDDQAIIERLKIPQEDLERVTSRRKIVTEKENLTNISNDIEQFKNLLEEKSQLSEEELYNYSKFKTNTFKSQEFLRFIDGLENLPLKEENIQRIFFTKLFYLSEEEKEIIWKFFDLDIKILKKPKINSWKNSLEIFNKSPKHTYSTFDTVSNVLEQFDKKIEETNISEAEEVFKDYSENHLEKLKECQNESDVYYYLINKHQFIREILYLMIKIKFKIGNENDLENLFNNIEKVYNNNFNYLTEIDFYDFILTCFIPLLKNTEKTSQEFREMESFLNKIFLQIPKIYNTNFEEEENLYFNIECVKYLLSKENKIKTIFFKKIFIDIINKLSEKIKDIQTQFNFNNKEIKIKFAQKYNIIILQLNELYSNLVTFIKKIINLSEKFPDSNEEIKDNIITEFKSYSKDDQNLIIAAAKLFEMFEENEKEKNSIQKMTLFLIKSFSVEEMVNEIKTNGTQNENVVDPILLKYYNFAMKIPKYNFDSIKFLTFKWQNQMISLIIKNNKNLENTAKIFENDFLIPNMKYEFFTEELFFFIHLFCKLKNDKNFEQQLKTDANVLFKKFQNDFQNEFNFVQNLNQNWQEKKNDCVDFFTKKFNHSQQKLILMFLNFYNDYYLVNDNNIFIKTLSCVYLQEKINFIQNLITNSNNPKANKIFIDSIYDDLKHVNYPLFVYANFNKNINFLSTFDENEKKIIEKIEQIFNKKFSLPNCLSFEQMLNSNDFNEINNDIKNNHPLINEFINIFNETEENSLDFKTLFEKFERDLIIKVLENNNKNVEKLKEINNDLDDEIKSTLKYCVLAETDENVNKNLPNNGIDLKYYYRKQLNFIEKNCLNNAKINYIKMILDYNYDPNNNYIYDNFKDFQLYEKIILVQIILCKLIISNKNTFYFDNILFILMNELLDDYISIANRMKNNEIYKQKLNEDFLYLISFYNSDVLKFIKNISNTENQIIFKFVNEFNEKERKIMIKFLEFYSILQNDEKYLNFKDDLQNYINDEYYVDRIENINNELDLLLANQMQKYMFIIVAEKVKETIFEIDYLIEKIFDSNEINNMLIYIYKTLDLNEKNIVIKLVKCLKEQNSIQILNDYLNAFEENKLFKEDDNIFDHVKNSLENFKEKLKNKVDFEDVENYEKFKITLNGICGDLINFVNKCAEGKISQRKIKAVRKDKIDIIKIILDCEFLINKNNNIKNAINFLKEFKYEK
jgi:hypothetical protein